VASVNFERHAGPAHCPGIVFRSGRPACASPPGACSRRIEVLHRRQQRVSVRHDTVAPGNRVGCRFVFSHHVLLTDVSIVRPRAGRGGFIALRPLRCGTRPCARGFSARAWDGIISSFPNRHRFLEGFHKPMIIFCGILWPDAGRAVAAGSTYPQGSRPSTAGRFKPRRSPGTGASEA